MDIGVRPEGVFTAAVRLPETQYKTGAQKIGFAQSLLEKSAHIAGVDAASISDHLPLEGGSNYYVKLRGQTSQMSNLLVERTVSARIFSRHGGAPDRRPELDAGRPAAGAGLDQRYQKITGRQRTLRPRNRERSHAGR